MPKEYLGDAAYVEMDGDCVIISTSNGITETNKIYLERDSWKALKEFVERNMP